MKITINTPFKKFIDIKTATKLTNNVFDMEKNHINIDRACFDIELRKILVILFEEIITAYCKETTLKQTIIVTPDNMRLTFGLTPVMSVVAYRLNTNLAVWKELGNFHKYEDIIFGNTDQCFNAIIVQDIINYGGTFFRMSDELNKTNWKIQKYYSLFAIRFDGFLYENNLAEIKNNISNIYNKNIFKIEPIIILELNEKINNG